MNSDVAVSGRSMLRLLNSLSFDSLVFSPGYVQSLIRRVANNVNIVVNNLILKYVEDDIVLSVNITSAECYTVDDTWERAFMDITGEQWLLTFLASRIN